jgi:hypothetical protein
LAILLCCARAKLEFEIGGPIRLTLRGYFTLFTWELAKKINGSYGIRGAGGGEMERERGQISYNRQSIKVSLKW